MTSQTSSITGWRRAVAGAVASGVLASGLITAVGSAPAWAEPTTEAQAPDDSAAPAPEMTADQALAIIQNEYDVGSGGGQLSTLIHKVLKLRQAGFKASASNKEAIVAALDKRPNQAPLIDALEATLAYQLRTQARSAAQQPQGPSTIGINQAPGGLPPGLGPTGGGAVLPIS